MYYSDDTLVFLDGKFIKAKDATVGLYNQTMHYGSGVFEGIRSYDTPDGTKVFKAKEHYERLHYSAEKMHIKLNYSVEELTQITYELLEKNNIKDAYIRPMIYVGDNMSLTPTEESHVFIAAWEWGKYLGDKMLRLTISSYQRPNPKSCHVDAKVTGHYINSILATTEAKRNGFDEALLLDAGGNVAEGPGANFFFEKQGVLYTTPLGNILPGITRATVLERANELGVKVREEYFKPEVLASADAAFFCGTAAEVAPIKSVDDYVMQMPWENSICSKIQKRYQRIVAFNEYSAKV